MTRRLIGTGTTDAQGRCVIEYTGTGAGLVNLQAEYSNEKDTIMSPIRNIYDVQYKDLGGVNGNDTDWTVSGMSVDRTTDTTCTILTQTTPSTFTSRYLNIGKYTNRPLVIEADISIDTGSDTKTGQMISVRYGASSTGSANWSASNLGITTPDWHHIKIIVTETTATLTIDNTREISRDITVNPNRFYFILNQDTSNSVIKYRNLIVY
jgi:hypothetical protein